MILGIGTDITDIQRFTHWHKKPRRQLLRLFSAEEIDYCQAIPNLSAERFAARFAAKEAFLKAYGTWQNQQVPLSAACKAVSVTKNKENLPYLLIDWQVFTAPFTPACHLSIAHSKTVAIAHVILSSS